MRKLMNSKDAEAILPLIQNKNARRRWDTQKVLFRVCPCCGKKKPINGFCVWNDVKNDPETITLYEICNACNTSIVKRREHQEMQQFIMDCISDNIDRVEAKNDESDESE